ncbi:MAG: cadherin domain-containing protein [Hydrogenophilales bacterium]|nr:cadherin domain-containing protein [Hydrogenophilales bacterium]
MLGSRGVRFFVNDGDGAVSINYDTTVNVPGAVTAMILDRFGSISYSNNDGTVNWLNSWQELGESNGPGTGIVEVDSSYRALEIGSGPTLLLFPTDITGYGAQRTADLSMALSATLSLSVSFTGVNVNGTSTLAISSDGTNWTDLQTFDFATTPATNTPHTYDISAFTSSTTRIRLVGSGAVGGVLLSGYFHADDIAINYTFNAAPVITSNGGGDSAMVSVAENTSAVTTVTAIDANLPPQTLTYTITGGADQALFTIDASTGVLGFLAVPDYEAPTDTGGDNVYDVTVQVSDGNGGTDSQAIAITVTPANDNAPVITSNGGGATAALSIAEGTTAVTTVTATDTDQPPQTLTYSIGGGADQALFQIDASSGVLSFVSAPDYETPMDTGGDNVYDVTVQASDGNGGTDSQAIAVTVTPVNDAPSGVSASLFSGIDEDTTDPVGKLVSDFTAATTDPDAGAVRGIAVYEVNNSNGQWQYTLDGSSWVDISSVSAASALLLPSDAVTRVRFVPDADYNGVAFPFSYRAWDQTSGIAGGFADTTLTGGSTAFSAESASVSVTVNPVNDAPSLQVPGPQTTPVDTGLVFSGATGNSLSVTDIDAGAGMVQVVIGVTHGTFTLSGIAGLSFSVGDGSADGAMTFTGTLSDINTALDGARFDPDSGYQGASTLSLATNDQGNTGSGGALSDNASVTIQVGALQIQEGLNGYTGAQDARIVGGILFANTNYGTETGIYQNADEQVLIRFDNLFGNGAGQIPYGATITAASLTVYVDNVGLSGSATIYPLVDLTWDQSMVTWNSVVNGVQLGSSEASNTADASISSASSGYRTFAGLEATLQSWSDGATNNGWVITKTIDDWRFMSSENATAVRRPYLLVSYTVPVAPVVTTSGGSANVNENDPPEAIDPALTVSDADSTNLAGATVRITTNHANGEDVLAFTDQLGISGSWDAGTGTLTLSGSASVAAYQTALRSVSYQNTSEDPGILVRTVEFIVSDGVLDSAPATRQVQVVSVNDAPTTNNASASGAEDAASIVLSVTGGDVDGTVDRFQLSSLPANGALYLDVGLTTSAATGVDYAASAQSLTLYFVPDENWNGVTSFQYIARDAQGAGDATPATATFTVTSANDDPVLDAIGDRSVTEGTQLSFTATATDADVPPDTLTYSLSGEPAGASITAGGVFTWTPTEAQGPNVYSFDVIVSDGQGGSDSETIQVTVSEGANQAPVLDAIGNRTVTEGTQLSFTATATDPDVPPGSLTYSLANGASGSVPSGASITAAGVFTWTPTEAQGPGAYTFDVVVSDGQGGSDSETIQVTVDEGNLPPVITSDGGGATATLGVTENGTSVTTVAASDADLPAQTLSYSINGGADAALFQINSASGVLSFLVATEP